MIKEIRFINWKSFKDAKVYIDPLNVLIGTNASGKSNLIDGIAFLTNAVNGINLQTSLDGQSGMFLEGAVGAIRGGTEYAAMMPGDQFTIETVIQEDEKIDYKYTLTVRTKPQVEVIAESLIKIVRNKSKNKETNMFTAYRSDDKDENPSPIIAAHTNNGKGKPVRKDLKNVISVISQLKNYEITKEVSYAIQFVIDTIEEIFILDPVPSLMRDYKPFSPYLLKNASNLAGMIAALPEDKKQRIERQLTMYLSKLPEGEITRVWTAPIGLFQKDAMLYCEEKWGSAENPTMIDARGMSDGTLRFLGILTALLTRPSGSLIVIEEVDNGLHPSRATLLLKTMQEIGAQRNIDLLITTHNPALMDELGAEMIPFIQVVHRNTEDGTSKITLMEDIKMLPKLLAHGSVGELSTKGEIEKSLAQRNGEGGVSNEK
ncbi:MAG: AAA family ATPase [Syntrophomonadaceae bacterium]|nr:AAA family ATPase [Syntrophomonadaceae bacterium]